MAEQPAVTIPAQREPRPSGPKSGWSGLGLGNIKIKPKMIGLFLVIGLLPLLIGTVLGIIQSGAALETQAFEHLSAVRQLKANRIQAFLEELENNVEGVAETAEALNDEGFAKLAAVQTLKKERLEDFWTSMQAQLKIIKDDPYLLEALVAFDEAFEEAGDGVDSAEWRRLANQYDNRLQGIMADNGWHDILLIHTDGDIVYTVQREADLGVTIPDSDLKDSSLGRAFAQAQTMVAEEIAVADFAPYTPSGGDFAAFMMAQMRDERGVLKGYVAFQLSTDKINEIVQDRTGLGETGETFLVGRADQLSSYRSDRVVKQGRIGNVRSGGYIDLALDGESGSTAEVGSTGQWELTVYNPLELAGVNWAMFTTMAVEEVVVPHLEGVEVDFLTEYAGMHGYHDIFLIDPTGFIFYTVAKEQDYQTNILDGPYSNSHLGRLVQQVLQSKAYAIVDFAPYEPSNNAQASFAAMPVVEANGEVSLIVAVQVPEADINAIMQERTGMGTTGETYLVGKRNDATAFRSDMQTMGDGEYVIGVEIQTPYIEDALAGNTAENQSIDTEGNPVMVSYQPIEAAGLNWAVIAKKAVDEVMAPANELRNTLIIVGVVIAVVVAAVAFLFAISIANPIQRITHLARSIAKGDLSEEVAIRQKDEIGQLADAFRDMGDSLRAKAETADQIAQGNLAIDVPVASEADRLGQAMVTMKGSLNAMAANVNTLIDAAVAGKLDARADASQFSGDYFKIVQGINDTLDAVIGPLNVAAEYVDRISKGDIPELIADEYRGDFNEIKNNLNQCIETLNGIISSMDEMYRAQKAGDFEAYIEATQFSGAYRQMVEGVNDGVRLHVNNILLILDILTSYADGDFSPVLQQLPGKQAVANEKMDLLRNNLRSLTGEVTSLTQAAVEGRLSTRADATRFQGDWAGLVGGVNATIETLVGHIDAMPAPAMIIDKEFNIRYMSQAGAEMLGVSQESLIGRKCYDSLKSGDCRTANCALARAMSSGQPETSETEAHPAGKNIQISYTGSPVRNQQGEIIGAMETIVDQTQIKTMMDTLQSSNSRLESAVAQYTAFAERVAAGDLSARLSLNGDGDDDALVTLGHNLNSMVERLGDMTAQIREATNNISSAAAEILAATTQQASGANEQSSAISQTTTTIDEVKTIVEQAFAKAQSVAEQSQRTTEISQAGQSSVIETVEGMNQIKEKVEGIAENILALSEQTQQIGEIIATVNEIAAQSNLLALNASVEAARAGEHGKGFAVVAVEVRNLAEQSRQATAQVKSILNEIQRATNSAVMSTEEGTKGVDTGTQLAGQAGETIQHMAASIAQSAQAAQQIVASAQQQTTGMEQIALAMENINQATVQSLASTRQAERAAQDLSSVAQQLESLVARYKLN